MTIKINLSDEEISSLKDIMKHHDNWRARERAQMLLLLSKGEKSSTIIGEVNVCISTLYSTIREWNKEKIAFGRNHYPCGRKLRSQFCYQIIIF